MEGQACRRAGGEANLHGVGGALLLGNDEGGDGEGGVVGGQAACQDAARLDAFPRRRLRVRRTSLSPAFSRATSQREHLPALASYSVWERPAALLEPGGVFALLLQRILM